MEENPTTRKPEIAIVGGGLCGCLLANYLAHEGYEVDIYERRPDWRGGIMLGGRSINLALSARGIEALARIGLDGAVLANALPMYGRSLHLKDGSGAFQPYGLPHQYNNSVGRQMMNDTLLNAAEKLPKVKVFFNHKVIRVDLDTPSLDVLVQGTTKTVKVLPKLIIATDGAFSSVRGWMQRTVGFDFSQRYLDHDYKELCIPPTKDGQFALPRPESLHIWPRGDFMMIALPNPDKSFTCTLFMPRPEFQKLDSDARVFEFFKQQFPDAVPLMPTLLNDWHANPTSNLVMISCNPHHYKDKVLLLGDAAHAMVPFYGQGMNSALQDVQVFCEILKRENRDFGKALAAYTKEHRADSDAVCRLSYENYMVMRSSVTSRMFRARKQLEVWLNWLFPRAFIPLYTMVSFTSMPYSEVLRRAAVQDKWLDRIFFGVPLAAALVGGFAVRHHLKQWVSKL